MWVLVGLPAGRQAGFVMKGGGYGLIGDIALGLVGSLLGSWIFRTLGVATGAGPLMAIVVAFIGAVLVIGAGHMLWTSI
jgi:uncharacterized membrane protein YeaQ/YmgE (transglycosylase-associated protein family)